MTKAEPAAEWLYDLWNDADHAARLTEEAKLHLSRGRPSEALDWLVQARKPIEMLEMRLRDAERAVQKAIDEATPKEETKP